MRIISGEKRGRKLTTLEGDNTRPTLERVKQMMFDCIQFEIRDKVVLDLFAGSGQLGLEALSRGASFAYFNDAARDAVAVIQKNVAACGFEKKSQVTCNSYIDCVTMLVSKGVRLSIVFLDPPYGTEMLTDAMQKLLQSDLLAEDALLICEYERNLMPQMDGFTLYKQKQCGKIGFTIFKRT